MRSQVTGFGRDLAVLAVLGAVLLRSAVQAGDIPFEEPFDDRATGVLHNQGDWQAHRQNDVQVQTATVFEGAKAGVVNTNTIVWNSFTNASATNVWVDFYARVPHPTNSAPPTLTGSVAAAFYVDADGKIRAVSNSTWVVLDYTLSSNRWYRFSVNLDYGNQRWELHMAGDQPNALARPVATNLAFSASSTNTHFRVFRVKN